MFNELSTRDKFLSLRLLMAGKVWVLEWGTLEVQGHFSFTLLCLERGPEQIMLGDIS